MSCLRKNIIVWNNQRSMEEKDAEEDKGEAG